MNLPYTLTHPDTTPPTRGTTGSAGLDLTTDETVVIPTGGRRFVTTGVTVAIPEGHFGLLLPRSSLGMKHGLMLANTAGVIDSDYRGEIRAMLVNTGDKPMTLQRGDRIVQLVLVPYLTAIPTEVGALDTTARGAGGFGSTGRGAL